MAAKPFTFHRPALAQGYCDSLQGAGIVDSRSGLFLAAPRRTGKSTFLREDLIPAMQSRGWTTVYVDLWSDKSKDPALLITHAIQAKIATFAGAIRRLAKMAGVEKINVYGALSLNLGALDLPAGLTLTDALQALVQAGEAPVALVVDEAQHALTSQNGVNSMFALKAARDHLNQGVDHQQFFLVMTGSNRDKLAHLVLKRDQPFFGSRITRFPLLDRAFTDAFTTYINRLLASDNQFDPGEMFEAFRLVGHRPEMLRGIAADIALNADSQPLAEQLKHGAEVIKQHAWAALESEIADLPDIQRAVLETLIGQEKNYAPFSEASMKAYARLLKQDKVSIASVQSALDALREKGLVWRAAYGDYALEDQSLAIWYKSRPSLRP